MKTPQKKEIKEQSLWKNIIKEKPSIVVEELIELRRKYNEVEKWEKTTMKATLIDENGFQYFKVHYDKDMKDNEFSLVDVHNTYSFKEMKQIIDTLSIMIKEGN